VVVVRQRGVGVATLAPVQPAAARQPSYGNWTLPTASSRQLAGWDRKSLENDRTLANRGLLTRIQPH
jgi:hypothetical protein